MKSLTIYQVDAFTDTPFSGNPAGVCLVEKKYDDSVLQAIAAEMNLSETAFLYPPKDTATFSLRWFTPKTEVSLCGHATLATAAVLFYERGIAAAEIAFETKSGTLTARKEHDKVLLDFPRNDSQPTDAPHEVLHALGVADVTATAYDETTQNLLVHLPHEKDVNAVTPDCERLSRVPDIRGVIVTASSERYDFISRYFAPWVGINEDPVTGSAHTVLTPYWSRILGKKEMHAYQASQRGGELTVRLTENRVEIIGDAVVVLKGELYL
jgi:PhzF family phenazine biosynthesis protein